MVNKVNLNTPEGKRRHFVQTVAGTAGGMVTGLGVAYLSEATAHKAELKDEFKAAKQALKDAKKQNLGEEAIKGAKSTLKNLWSKVNKDSLKLVKQMVKPAIAAFAVISVLYGLVFPAVNEYLHGKSANKAAKAGK